MNNYFAEHSLLYRRQFLFTPKKCRALESWKEKLIDDFHLYVHPDLNISMVKGLEIELYLLGYILDPHNPTQSNEDILKRLANKKDSVEEFSNALSTYSGRFALIFKRNEQVLFFHDPCGFRSIFYTKFEGQIFVGSQPSIFKNVIPLKEGKRYKAFKNSKYIRENIEYWLPSGISLFDKVKHLIPNHYLVLSKLKQVRYWPNEPLSHKTLDEVKVKVSNLLKDSLNAANYRFDLTLTLTAGWDSRVLLAASKKISDEVFYYTLQFRDLDQGSADIDIPSKLLELLGLDHTIIDCRKEVPDSFYELYNKNVSNSHFDDWGKIAFGMSEKYPKGKVSLKGNSSEIGRCFYYKNGHHDTIGSADQIVSLVKGWDEINFIQRQVQQWYKESSDIAKRMNIDILDLFYWEHRMGSWQAQSQLEWDLVQESYVPYNNREILELMLSTSKEYRCAPRYVLHEKIAKYLWPEVMSQPVNPPILPKYLKNTLDSLGLYNTSINIYRKYFK